MTSLERMFALQQIIQNLEGLRRDMRANAMRYAEAASAQSYTVAQIRGAVAGDASEYIRRLDMIANIPAETLAELRAYAASISLDPADIQATYTELRAAATAQQGATLNTFNQIINGASAILGMVAPHYSLW